MLATWYGKKVCAFPKWPETGRIDSQDSGAQKPNGGPDMVQSVANEREIQTPSVDPGLLIASREDVVEDLATLESIYGEP